MLGSITLLLAAAALGCSRWTGRARPESAAGAWDDASQPGRSDTRRHQTASTGANRPGPQSRPATPPTSPNPEIVAVVDGVPIYKSRIVDLLWKGRGDAVLDVLIELRAVRHYAASAGVRISRQDVDHEMDLAVDLMDESPAIQAIVAPLQGPKRRQAIVKYLQTEYRRSKGICPEEFILTLRRNAYLRKLVQRDLSFSPQELQAEFDRLYGEKVQVRHILLRNLQDAQRARQWLQAGEPFESVAQRMSTDVVSQANGGLLKPFTRTDQRYPQLFRKACFSLEPGQVSKIVRTPLGFHIIKLERRIPRSQVRLALVRDRVERELSNRRTFELMEELRQRIMQAAKVRIEDPDLARLYHRKHRDRP